MPPSVADLDRLRAEGWPSHAPLRWRVIESLARRAAAADAALRARLEARLAVLLTDYGSHLNACSGDAPSPGKASADDAAPGSVEPPRPERPLAALLAHIAEQSGPAGELRTLQRFRRTWSRLAADQRVLRSRLNLPPNAGPLNSQHLVHRAMTLMHELSPEYLERFVAHADALLWLDRALGGDLPLQKEAAAQTAGGAMRGAAGGGTTSKAGGGSRGKAGVKAGGNAGTRAAGRSSGTAAGKAGGRKRAGTAGETTAIDGSEPDTL